MAFVKSYLHSPAWSDACYDGNGHCDGIVDGGPYDGEPCGCGCHDEGVYFDTYREVEDYHEGMQQYN